MNNKEKENLGTDKLFDVLKEFVAEAMKCLRQHSNITLIPKVRRYTLHQENNITKIIPSDQPNWWQVSGYINQIFQLDSYNAALQACRSSSVLLNRNGQRAYALNNGCPFHVALVPEQFLIECLVRENGFRFNKNTVSEVFRSLIDFVNSSTQNKACLIAPIDAVVIEKKCINLDSNMRIKRLSPAEVVDLVNHCPTLGHFFGYGFSSWFSTVIEIDFTFKWYWEDEKKSSQEINLKNFQKMQIDEIMLSQKLSEEIIIIRSLLNKKICTPTYVIDYRGWNSVISTGGAIHHLPWQRNVNGFPIKIDKKDSYCYLKYRNQFINTKDENTKRRIFSAMRRLSAAVDGAYAADKLFDAVAGIEGLLVAEQTEVSHKLAERTAIFIGNNADERINLFDNMKKAYDLRSKVAHGAIVADDLCLLLGNGKLSKKQIDEFNSVNQLSGLCMKYLHMAIKKCIAWGTANFDWKISLMSGRKIK